MNTSFPRLTSFATLIRFTNSLDIKIYSKLPVYAVDIRNEVFVKEQGFREEFDGDDKKALHLVGFIGEKSVATSRILRMEDGSFIIGRIAVRKQYRKQGLGAKIIDVAENAIRKMNGKYVYIHAQRHAVPFYEKQGYIPTGEKDFEEGCEHWMLKKDL